MKLTKDFLIEELQCKCGRCEVGRKPTDYDETLLIRLQGTRDNYGRPVFINSGARCHAKNQAEGGKANSAHLPLDHGPEAHPQWKKVRAVDVACIGSRNRYEIVEAARKAGFRRIGIARTFVHLDTAFGGPYDPDVIWLY